MKLQSNNMGFSNPHIEVRDQEQEASYFLIKQFFFAKF